MDLCRTAAIVIASGVVYYGDMMVRQNFELLPHCRRLIHILAEKSTLDGPRRALKEHRAAMWEALALMGVVFRQNTTLRSADDQLHMAMEAPTADPAYRSLGQLLKLVSSRPRR